MGLTAAELDTAVAERATRYLFLGLHSAEPDDSGSDETSATRMAASWTDNDAGQITAEADLAFTGGAASGACTHLGLWSLVTGGSFGGSFALTGDQSFNAAGEYTLDSFTLADQNPS